MKMKVEMIAYLLLPFLITFHSVSPTHLHVNYESIFNFGNSLSDTGNYLTIGAPGLPVIGHLPYGETFFKNATGRCSDGRLIVDFIADAFRLPFLPPYLKLAGGPYVKTGVNFAVVGATALDPEFFYARNLGPILLTNDSLSVQIGWFKKWKSKICTTKQECDSYLKTSLFVVGEIGGNDYNVPLIFTGAPIEQVRPLVPLVIQAVINATTALIEEGAVNLLVPGNFPIGCVPAYLTTYLGSNQSDYNPKTGCMDAFNELSEYHNEMLIEALETLRGKYPQARIMYADFYGASIGFYYKPELYGFSGGSIIACCGGGGPYNFNLSRVCGQPGSTLCKEPSTYASWDGVHWTEAAYRYIANEIIYGPFTSPPLRFPPS